MKHVFSLNIYYCCYFREKIFKNENNNYDKNGLFSRAINDDHLFM